MQSRKKYRLRPWFKIAMLFVIGVIAVSNIFSIFGTMASNEELENKIIHGVVRLNVNGESHLAILEDEYKGDIVLDRKKGYDHLEVVTVVLKGEKIINNYLTTGDELKTVEKEFDRSITIIRGNIIDALYE